MKTDPSLALVFKKYRRTTPGQRLQWVRRYLNSGMTHREFCRRYGVSTSALSEWLRYARRQQEQAAHTREAELSRTKPVLKEMSLGAVLGGPRWVGELVFPSGTVVRLSAEMSTQVLEQIIKAVIC